MSSSATYVAVIDGDLQHDETRLPVMLAELRSGQYDLAVASRHVEGGNNAGLANQWRHMLSDGGIWLAQQVLPVKLADPMSGFFMLRRTLFEQIAPQLTGQGFKILLDLVLSAPMPLRVKEVPAEFHERVAGESKLDALVVLQFAGLLLDKTFAGYLPLRFASFAAVGAIGVMVHLAVLGMLRGVDAAELWPRANDRDAGGDGVQFRIEQCDHLSPISGCVGLGCGGDCCCSWRCAGLARWPISASPRRCMTRTRPGRLPVRWARLSVWSGIMPCRRLWCGAVAAAMGRRYRIAASSRDDARPWPGLLAQQCRV